MESNMVNKNEDTLDGRSVKGSVEEKKCFYPSIQSTLLPALYEAEKVYGWLSQEAIEDISKNTGITPAFIKGTATFYSMYRNKPLGKHLIQLCTNITCLVLGAEDLVDLLKEEYGLTPGGTTDDGLFSLIIMECIGACGTGPAMLVNSDFYENLNKTNLLEILLKYK